MKKVLIMLLLLLAGSLTVVGQKNMQVTFNTKFVTSINLQTEEEVTYPEYQDFYFDYKELTLIHITPEENRHQIYKIIDIDVDELDKDNTVFITTVKSTKTGDRYVFHLLLCTDGSQSLALVLTNHYVVFHN